MRRRVSALAAVKIVGGAALVLSPLPFSSRTTAVERAVAEPTVDSFVRIQAPTRTFGGAGALCVAGTSSINHAGSSRGRFDSMMKFATLPIKTQFDTAYGVGQWQVSQITLTLSEDPDPNNITFPVPTGAGTFEIFWFSNDNWLESTGTPNSPHTGTGTDLTWSYLTAISAGAQQQSLGQFESAGAAGLRTYSLTPSPGLLAELNAGNVISLRLVAVTARLGYTFYSKDHTQGEHPTLEFFAQSTVAAIPGDMNCDGALNNFDIDPFALAIVDVAAYAAAYPGCSPMRGDMNHDGLVNNFDIDPFVACVVSGCP